MMTRGEFFAGQILLKRIAYWWSIGHRVCNPAVDSRFVPTSSMNADANLRRESAIGDLAIYSRAGQPGPGEDGFQADDAFGVGHGSSSIIAWSLHPS
jgi:hypothetical protein